jgi:hypothetical protein
MTYKKLSPKEAAKLHADLRREGVKVYTEKSGVRPKRTR